MPFCEELPSEYMSDELDEILWLIKIANQKKYAKIEDRISKMTINDESLWLPDYLRGSLYSSSDFDKTDSYLLKAIDNAKRLSDRDFLIAEYCGFRHMINQDISDDILNDLIRSVKRSIDITKSPIRIWNSCFFLNKKKRIDELKELCSIFCKVIFSKNIKLEVFQSIILPFRYMIFGIEDLVKENPEQWKFLYYALKKALEIYEGTWYLAESKFTKGEEFKKELDILTIYNPTYKNNFLNIFKEDLQNIKENYPFSPASNEVLYQSFVLSSEFNHNYVIPEHFFLSILNNGAGMAISILQNLGLDIWDAKNEFEDIVKKSEVITDNFFMNLISQLINISRDLKTTWIGTEHILLALLKEKNTVSNFLEQKNINYEKCEKEFLKIVRKDSE